MTREEEIQKLIDEENGIINYGSCDYQVGVRDGVRLADKNPCPQTIAEYLYKEKGYPISLNGEIPTFEETMKDVQTYNDYKAKQGLEEGAKWADNHPVNVWHDANEKPRTKEWLLVQFDEDDYDTLYFIILSIDMWCDLCKTYHVIQWAYIRDMLPKGGKK